MIFVNFKTYEQGTGQKAVSLVRLLEEVAIGSGVKVVPVLQPMDLLEASQASGLEIWVQNIDSVEYGAHTGSVLPEAVVEDGARGTFLNHSEHRFADFAALEAAHGRARSVGLKTLIFAGDIQELERIVTLKPDFVSYEPPELVGKTDVSVSSAHPDVIAKAAEITKAHSLPLIIGAGVHSQEDVRTGMRLGATGIAVATDIVKAEDPKRELLDLIEGFK